MARLGLARFLYRREGSTTFAAVRDDNCQDTTIVPNWETGSRLEHRDFAVAEVVDRRTNGQLFLLYQVGQNR
jgi:hypothetical protein